MSIDRKALDAAIMAALNVRRKCQGYEPITKDLFLRGLPVNHWAELVQQQTAALEAYEAMRAPVRETGNASPDWLDKACAEVREEHSLLRSLTNSEHRCWLVESRVADKFDGWFTAPEKGTGGWLTENPNQAKLYTREEAEAVAQALSYFPAPFKYSKWAATEHVFLSNVIEGGKSDV